MRKAEVHSLENRPQQIDIAQVIQQKTGKKLPSLVGKLAARIIHQEDINSFIRRHYELEGIDFAEALLRDLSVEVEWLHKERLPEDGRAIFVSNHPLGGLDGMAIAQGLGRHYGDMRFVVNDMLYYLENLRNIFLPVNTYGSQKASYMEQLREAFESELPIATFPAGYCSRKNSEGELRDRPWRKSFVSWAMSYERDIVPLYFVGENSKRFYRADWISRKLKSRLDLGTLLLPSELFRSRGKRYQIIVGEPIPHKRLQEAGRSPLSWAEEIYQYSYSLPNNP